MREFNKFHLDLILNKISYFEKNELDLITLIAELDGLKDILKGVDQDWRYQAFSFWFDLEEIYAYNCSLPDYDAEHWTLNDEEKQIVAESVIGFKNLANLEIAKIENLEGIYSEDLESLKTAEIGDETWLICPICIDAWKSISSTKTVECLKCKTILMNPRISVGIPEK